ncbi:MAG: efflux RND transporter periplasmic adaptor subunit [Psychroflexus halocasei]
MKNNKIIIYIGLLAAGVLLGWLFFGNSSKEKTEHQHDEVAETNQMWTCSMHPQIMQPESGDCPICGMDLIPAESGADGLAPNEIKMTKNAMALANIQTSIVGNAVGENGNTTSLSGKIVENEEANSVQASYFDGRIERLNVNYEGQEVRKGQLLATIYSPNLIAAQQELLTTASLKESQPALYRSVRNKLKNWKLSEKQINSIEESGKVREFFPIYATVSGTVSEKMLNEGDYVKQGQPILKLNNLSTVWAEFDAYENQISQFKKGQKIKIKTNAYPEKEFEATISFINPLLNTQTRIVTVRATINNKDNLLKPGMFVSGQVEGVDSSKEKLLIVPASAVMWTGERSLVYVKTNPEKPIFEMREVTIGNRNGETYTITEGLESGDEIVTHGTFTVDAAAQLQNKKSMMNQTSENTKTAHDHHEETSSHSSENTSAYTKTNKRLEAPQAFQKQLNKVYKNYIDLKDALVQDNTAKATEDAKALLNNSSQVDMTLVKGEAHDKWMSLSKEIKASATAISETSDLKAQRKYFRDLSLHFIKAVQIFGVNEKVYVEFCPMADSYEGAYWLSQDEKVINPYFGDAMLTCGEVKEIIE